MICHLGRLAKLYHRYGIIRLNNSIRHFFFTSDNNLLSSYTSFSLSYRDLLWTLLFDVSVQKWKENQPKSAKQEDANRLLFHWFKFVVSAYPHLNKQPKKKWSILLGVHMNNRFFLDNHCDESKLYHLGNK